MRLTGVLAVLLLCGCPKQGANTALGPSHPELVCGEDAVPTGAVPPEGLEAWCRRINGRGDWSREGTYILWHENQQKAAQGQYKVDKRHGPWSFWFATGQVEKQGTYKGGVEDGFWTYFHPGDKNKAEGMMVDGKEHGPWVYWSEDGDDRTEGTWALGNKEGVWTTYDRDDRPLHETVYRAGRLISKREL